jgi:hypothetical protein
MPVFDPGGGAEKMVGFYLVAPARLGNVLLFPCNCLGCRVILVSGSCRKQFRSGKGKK